MKKLIPFLLVISLFLSKVSWGQIFSQDFNSGGATSDYVSTSPNSNQFDNISATTGSTVSILGNALVLTRSTGGHSRFVRSSNLSASSVNGLIFKFDVSVSNNTTATTSACKIFIGSSVGNNSSTPNSADYYARLYLNITGTNGEFQIRDSDGNTNSLNLSGTQTITWVLNNTGSNQSYTAPNLSTENIANDKIDIWAGTNKIFDDINPQNVAFANSLVQFKAVFDIGIGSFTFDNFLINGEASALPVELTSFTALIADNGVHLNWETATEVNNYGFNVERRVKNEEWSKIGFVNGNGNSNSPKSYTFTDNAVPAGKIQYRLKQIDFDGKFEYSEVVEVNVEAPNKLVLYQNSPNPFNPSTVISYKVQAASHVTLKVYDVLGRKVATLVDEYKNAGNYKTTFNVETRHYVSLQSGVYFYRLTAVSFVQTKKMMLLK